MSSSACVSPASRHRPPADARRIGRASWRAVLALLWALLTAWPAWAAPATPNDARVLTVFVREGCPHCTDAKAFLAQLAVERPALRIAWRPVDEDPEARAELERLSRAAGIDAPGVPTFLIDDRLMVGFDDAAHAGRELVALIDRQARPLGEVDGAWLGTLSASRLGLPLFALALGLLDGFNPCAMWVLLFLLSLLVHLRDRRRMALVAGTFVLASGAVYYAFMAAWLNIFVALGMSTAVRTSLALLALGIGAFNVKDFVAFGRGPSLSIPAAVKPGLYARMRAIVQARALPASLLGVAALAVVVNVVELLCTAGLPAIFTAVLAQQGLSTAAHHGYLGLYILGYLADDTLMVGAAVIALGSGKLSERAGRGLKLLSGLVMLALGAVLLWRPHWLM
jgi:glutaredoxin